MNLEEREKVITCLGDIQAMKICSAFTDNILILVGCGPGTCSLITPIQQPPYRV